MVDRFARFYISELERTDFREGCPLMAAAVAGAKEEAAVPAANAFTQIHEALTDSLTGAGVKKPRASSLATLAISAIEGAIILSRPGIEPNPSTRPARNSTISTPPRSPEPH